MRAFSLMASDLSNAEIAGELVLSKGTVKTHVRHGSGLSMRASRGRVTWRWDLVRSEPSMPEPGDVRFSGKEEGRELEGAFRDPRFLLRASL